MCEHVCVRVQIQLQAEACLRPLATSRALCLSSLPCVSLACLVSLYLALCLSSLPCISLSCLISSYIALYLYIASGAFLGFEHPLDRTGFDSCRDFLKVPAAVAKQ